GNQRRNVKRAVLPRCAPHRPREGRGSRLAVAVVARLRQGLRGQANPGRPGRVIRCCIHVAVVPWCAVTWYEGGGSLALFLITATNKSAMLGLRISPSAASWSRFT